MTNNHGFETAMETVRMIAKLVSDPFGAQKLKAMQAAVQSQMDWARNFNRVEGEEKAPDKGTCPTCGKQYIFKGELGGIRRHGKGECYMHTNMAAEIIPAVRLIAALGDIPDDGNSHGTSERNEAGDV